MANTHALLLQIVENTKCMPGWSFELRSSKDDIFPKLVISVNGRNSAKPHLPENITVQHLFPIPEATYNEASWRRWIFECCRGVMNHELGEWFRVRGERPFQPLHGPGENPYVVHEFRPMVDALTTQNGSVREPYQE